MISSRANLSRNLISIPTLLLAASLALPSCKTGPSPVGIGTRGEGATKIMERAPIDIAVLPVVNNTGKNVPASVLRASFQQGLVERRYSPLSLEYVDRNITEASYNPGASQEQAVCTIEIARWDTSLWETHNALQVNLVVRIVDATSGQELWKGSVDQRFDLGTQIENLPTETQRIQKTCDILSTEVLQKLPPRVARSPMEQ
ncbi:MAG: DUF4136 domain-containing protein [Planctomycetota bacterium]|nr:DUF4136 domain-containing protein [Planctomycetota bacterium]